MTRIPTATYRVQLHAGFTLAQARDIVDYVAGLGISDMYASPLFYARKGSTHGYDVLDLREVNPELGGTEAFNALTDTLRLRGLGLLQDIVPNHMAFDGANPMLNDIFENGRDSRYYSFFDIEWNHPYESIKGKVLAPMLGSRFGEALEKHEITLGYDEQGLAVHYYQQRFPVRIQTYVNVLAPRLPRLRMALGREHPDYIKFLGVLYVLKNLSSASDSVEMYDQVKFVKRMLWELYHASPQVHDFLDQTIAFFNGGGKKSEGLDMFDALLGDQCYRLAYWKVATEELNYRRFFSINDLISLRIEDENVFRETHSSILRMVKEGKFTGLRIDHIDGLYDPVAYLNRLRAATGEIYITVEKILTEGEGLPSDWPVQGTTGYDFLNAVNGVFCDRKHEGMFDTFYRRFTASDTPYEDLVSRKKRLIIGKHMAGDIDNLAHLIKKISSKDRYGSDITLYGLRRALVEIMSFFPVYRTYIRPGVYAEADCGYMQQAVGKARERNPDLLNELQFIESFLLLKFPPYLSEDEKGEWVHFVMRFQQYTGPLMAKGFEDTTLYLYNRFVSLNDVGGSPNRFGMTVDEFHQMNSRRASDWPGTMNATATHDTKRGEDTRARMNVLSEMPKEWTRAVARWAAINRGFKRAGGEDSLPDRNDEYLLYQTLIGTFPLSGEVVEEYVKRIQEYMIKAVREAKLHTAWLKPDQAYEDALLAFIQSILSSGQFLDEFRPFHQRVARYGIYNSLSQEMLKLASPGVPDLYQGTELWDFSLVDPDNRRPVDYALRSEYLKNLREAESKDPAAIAKELLLAPEDGRVKMFLIMRLLGVRAARQELFAKGSYVPLRARGRRRYNVIAFARRIAGQCAVAVVPRFYSQLAEDSALPPDPQTWGDTRLELPSGSGEWHEACTGRTLPPSHSMPVKDILQEFPVALLVRDE